jgi:hypothetical protein
MYIEALVPHWQPAQVVVGQIAEAEAVRLSL